VPRSRRIVVPHLPHHVVHRGHDRKPIFAEEADYRRYLDRLRDCKTRFSVKLYAYCLMTNHVHLIVDPGDDVQSIAHLMKRLAGGFTQYVNKLENRTGTLWEGRYRSTPVDSEHYLLTCCRYVELNPVRAGLVRHPRDYRWSSYRQKAGLDLDRWLDLDPYYLSLGQSWQKRAETYEFSVGAGVSPGELEVIRAALRRGRPTGGESFVNQIAAKLGRRSAPTTAARPKA